MTLKVVHGLVRSDLQQANQTQRAVNQAVQQHSTATVAQSLGSVGANEAALTTVRSSRNITTFDRIKEPNEAQRVAKDVAEQVLKDEELAFASHGPISSSAAKDYLL